MKNLLLEEETYQIIGICLDIHQILGHGFSEAVYKDAIELEAKEKEMIFEREKAYNVYYKGTKLCHKFIADFEFFNSVILEVKASDKGISDDHIAQTLNYIRVSGNKVGLIVNLGRRSLQQRRLIY